MYIYVYTYITYIYSVGTLSRSICIDVFAWFHDNKRHKSNWRPKTKGGRNIIPGSDNTGNQISSFDAVIHRHASKCCPESTSCRMQLKFVRLDEHPTAQRDRCKQCLTARWKHDALRPGIGGVGWPTFIRPHVTWEYPHTYFGNVEA